MYSFEEICVEVSLQNKWLYCSLLTKISHVYLFKLSLWLAGQQVTHIVYDLGTQNLNFVAPIPEQVGTTHSQKDWLIQLFVIISDNFLFYHLRPSGPFPYESATMHFSAVSGGTYQSHMAFWGLCRNALWWFLVVLACIWVQPTWILRVL